MSIPVKVGPEYSADLIPAAIEAWQRLATATPDLVVEFVPDFRPYGDSIGRSIAASVLEYDLRHPTD